MFERLVLTAAIVLACAQSSPAGLIAENLPPCSAGVAPCRVEDSAPPPTQNSPAAAAVPTTSMLPCPLSVPCIATGDVDQLAPAAREPGAKPPPASAGLVLRVTPDDDDIDSAPPHPAARSATRRPAAPSLAANAPSRSVAAASSAPASVSLEGTGDLKRRAEQSVNDLGAELAGVDASAFNADDAQTYLQAIDLERAARRALSDRDYLVALDLSRKATDLAGILSGRRNRLR